MCSRSHSERVKQWWKKSERFQHSKIRGEMILSHLLGMATVLPLSTLFFIQNCSLGWFPTHLDSGCFQGCFLLKEHPSVSLAFPPVGRQRTASSLHRKRPYVQAKKCWFYSVLGISQAWSRNWGSAPGASGVSSAPLLAGDEGGPSERHVVLGGHHQQNCLSVLFLW